MEWNRAIAEIFCRNRLWVNYVKKLNIRSTRHYNHRSKHDRHIRLCTKSSVRTLGGIDTEYPPRPTVLNSKLGRQPDEAWGWDFCD